MNKILAEVSIGELLDKISILEIKHEKIKDPEKLKFILDEHSILKDQLNKNVKTDILHPTLIAKTNKTRVCIVTGTGGISIFILADNANNKEPKNIMIRCLTTLLSLLKYSILFNMRLLFMICFILN